MSKDSKLMLLKEILDSAEYKIKSAKQLLAELGGEEMEKSTVKVENYAKMAEQLPDSEDDSIVEGVFDGQNMAGKDEKQYPVPANYASKSKLIPGDVLKLTIKEDGTFLYKQIGPAERQKVIGVLTYEDGQYRVIANGTSYKVLLASVTYFKAEIGDNVTLVIPANTESEWGAIENVLPKNTEMPTLE